MAVKKLKEKKSIEKSDLKTTNRALKKEDKLTIEKLPEKKSNYIVGIGASAGGLEALESFFTSMSSDSGCSFIVVQHLSPDYKSLMLEILSKYTQMKVVQVQDGMEPQPNHVYLMPRKKNMTIFHGKLFLSEQDHDHANLNLPIDLFLKSLAEDQEDKAIAIILSGTGSDGTRGIRRIRETGGLVIVQARASAKFDGMPQSAISTGIVDYILAPEEMPDILLKHIKHPHISRLDNQSHLRLGQKTDSEQDDFSKILELVKNETGNDFSFYKTSTMIRRIEHRMSINQIDKLKNYLKYLYHTQTEVKSLAKELLIGVTQFFRDEFSFEIIEKKIIPEIFKTNKKTVRIWAAGCSTGEEAYSLAILFKEYMIDNDIRDIEVKIFATDIDKNALEYASTGIYSESMSADISKERLRKFFFRKGDTYQIAREVREMVIFAQHNVAKDPPFSKIDLISCRNLLIYLQPKLQKKIFATFSFALNSGGFLFLGPSESLLDFSEYFSCIDVKWKLYQYKSNSKPAPMPVSIPDGLSTDFLKNARDKLVLPIINFDKAVSIPLNEDKILTRCFETILENNRQTCVVINEDAELIHIYSDINKYLKVSKGKAQLNLLKMVEQELNIALGTAIHRAFRDQKKIIYSDVTFTIDEKIKNINLIINPFIDHHRKEKLALVTFEEKEKIIELSEVQNFNLNRESSQRIADLEYELQYTKENLRATVEELVTSNEELQATNEELLASNEELSSTNEELQSVNEELITVNSEYQSKIGELTELNNDINSLYSSAEIGTIFLDKDLCIRKFTSGIKKEINIINHDIGRPLEHISHHLKYHDLIRDVQNVLETIKSIEREVQGKNDNWYLLRIQSYRTTENLIKGVVIILIDISSIKKAEENLKQESKERLKLYKESIELQGFSEAIISFDLDYKILSWNKGAEIIYGWKEKDVIGFSLNKVLHSDFIDQTEDDTTKDYQKKGYWIGKIIHQRKDGSKIIVVSHAVIVKNAKNKAFAGMVLNRDITADELMDYSNLGKNNKIIKYFETAKSLFIVVSKDGKLKFINKQACHILNYKQNEVINKNWFKDLIPTSSKKVVKNMFEIIIDDQTEKIDNYQYPVFTNNDDKLISWQSNTIKANNGNVIGILSEGKLKNI